MVQSRLQSRLKELNLSDYSAYVNLVFDSATPHPELIHMVDRITTNKTEFFREPSHFDFLKNTILPQYVDSDNTNPLRIWSAACSSGEEPYTIAMVIQEFREHHPSLRYSILGTDLSTKMLQEAKMAIFTESKSEPIPPEFKRKYLLRSKDKDNKQVRIVPEIRENVSFDTANLIEDSISRYGIFDIIFCRNVLIYFDRETQLNVINRLCRQIHPGGYLMTGHSEALTNFDLPLLQIRPAVYRKK
jgi:chemotaxis protein methyltransferase CheR